jgi:multiple sugar transport system permease protein
MLRNTHFLVATLATIGSMKMFDQAFIASNGTGGPDWSTITVVFYIYRLAFADVTLGYAGAVGVALLLVIVGMVLVQRRLFPEEGA